MNYLTYNCLSVLILFPVTIFHVILKQRPLLCPLPWWVFSLKVFFLYTGGAKYHTVSFIV
jgi:hypothetical protein